VSLLRVTQIEPRKGLMREILDCLVPTLVDKLGTRGDDGKVIWVRCGTAVVINSNSNTNLNFSYACRPCWAVPCHCSWQIHQGCTGMHRFTILLGAC
jgi:hypothetical protein